MSFISQHGLWTQDQQALAADVLHRIRANKLGAIRVGFPDQHGIMRGKTLMPSAIADAFANGVSMTSTLFLKDTAHRTVMPVFTRGRRYGIRGI